MKTRTPSRIGGTLVAVTLLAGCGGDMSDLEAYINEVKSRTSSVVDPIPKMKPYTPFAYSGEDKRSPFVPERVQEPEVARSFSGSGLRPPTNRNKEPLEAFPLGGLRMVGTLDMKGNYFALVNSPDGVVHRVTVGNYMGQNYGRITTISDGEISLEEIVPDGFGGYVKRPARVVLSDS